MRTSLYYSSRPICKGSFRKKVLPFHIKVLEDKIYIINDCSNSTIPGGSQILKINGKNTSEIINAILPGIASDGYIQTRKLRLMERYFFQQFHGFDLYHKTNLYHYRELSVCKNCAMVACLPGLCRLYNLSLLQKPACLPGLWQHYIFVMILELLPS